MAKASVETTRRVVKETAVTLTLTTEEAEAIAVITGLIAGDADETPRGLTQGVHDELIRAGVEWWNSPLRPAFNGVITTQPL